MKRIIRRAVLVIGVVLFAASLGLVAAIVLLRPQTSPASAPMSTPEVDLQGDQELAHLLVKLELRTRAVIGGHYTRSQSLMPGIDTIYKRWLAKNAILPAAVADRIFSEIVPGVTGGRAWVKMVVDEPRNPNNRGDDIALELLDEIQSGKLNMERSTNAAYYYAEPIKSTKTCLPCHGEPEGAADPLFPQYVKNGWKEGEIVGAVVARVAPESGGIPAVTKKGF